jgi:aryl carrier-like protein
VGVTGELYLGGAGLARGYLGRPGETAARFVPDPFCPRGGARMYRTGDLVRWDACGELEYLGRADYQVKVRGFRVEPGEVEDALRSEQGVREAVVVARGAEGDSARRLVGYVELNGEGKPNGEELRRRLREHLPEYMVPSALVIVEEWPLTPNGKLDRARLPEPETVPAAAGREYVEPRTAVEYVVADIWARVLKGEKVGAHDNFFELGGHSLLGMQMVTRVREALGVEVPLRALFESPTLSAFAEATVALEAKPGQTERVAQIWLRVQEMSAQEAQETLERRGQS